LAALNSREAAKEAWEAIQERAKTARNKGKKLSKKKLAKDDGAPVALADAKRELAEERADVEKQMSVAEKTIHKKTAKVPRLETEIQDAHAAFSVLKLQRDARFKQELEDITTREDISEVEKMARLKMCCEELVWGSRGSS
jgi:hypothetical protein